MNSRDIVRKAWQITQVHLKKLLWYGTVPAFFSIVFSSGYMAYQYNAFRHSELFAADRGSSTASQLGAVWDWVSANPGITTGIVIAAILFFIGYFIIPPIFRGTLIQAIMKIKEYKPIAGSLEIGIRRFFPLFEFGVITGSFSITTLFTESSFIARWWGLNILMVALPVLLFIAMVGLLASFLFMYSEYFIVLEGKGLIESMKESVILVVANLRKTILVFILMLLIGARVILNVLLVLVIPMIIVFASSYLADLFTSTAGMIIIGLLSFAVLIASSYLLGLFHIFATAVWVLTYCAIGNKEEPKIHDIDLGGGEAAA